MAYKRWACAVLKPADQASDMHFTREEIAAKLRNREFHGLPVRLEHTDYTVGSVGEAYQTRKHGSLFVRLDMDPSTLPAETAINAVRKGLIRGVSLSHNPINKQLHECSLTKVPGREGTYLIPEDAPVHTNTSDPTRANFSYFDSLEYVSQPTEVASTSAMSAEATPPQTQATPPQAQATPASNSPPAPKEAPKDTKSADQPANPGDELTPDKIETIAKNARLIREENERMKQELEKLRKQTEPLTKQRVEETKKFFDTIFEKVARETPEQKAKADEAQKKIMEVVLTDETLSEVMTPVIKQSLQPVQPTNPANSNNNPRQDEVRASLKRGREMTPDMRALLDMTTDSKREEDTGRFRKPAKDPVLQSIFQDAFSMKMPAPTAAYSQTDDKQRQIVERFTQNYREQSMSGLPMVDHTIQQYANVEAWQRRI